MRRKSVLLALAALAAPALCEPLPPHPRLRLTDRGLAALRATLAADADAAAVLRSLEAHGEDLLRQPPVNCTPAGVEASLLAQARSVLDTTYSLGLLYRLSGNETYAARAVAEMLHVADDSQCPTWNPSHFLDTAEMTHALAVGYDWLYHSAALSSGNASARAAVGAAIARKGLAAGAAQNAANFSELTTPYNWNLVCNGGLAVGALALLGDEDGDGASRALARQALDNATRQIPLAFATFAPHGAWPEGPTYWGYAAKYALAAIGALRTANATPCAAGNCAGWEQLAASPGLAETGLYALHSMSPANGRRLFNWGDSSAGMYENFRSNLLLLAQLASGGDGGGAAGVTGAAAATAATTTTTTASAYRAAARRLTVGSGSKLGEGALTLLGFDARGSDADIAALPSTASFALAPSGWDGQTALGMFRSGWDAFALANASAAEVDASWLLAFKGGNGEANHNDVDAGDFVLELGGQRWAEELGSDSYGLPGYFSKSAAHGKRYSYYRKATDGANTLTFDNRGDAQDPGWCAQDLHGVAPIAAINASARWALLDLLPAYATQGGPSPPLPPAKRAERGFAVLGGGGGDGGGDVAVLVVDEFDFVAAANVTWAMHTKAAVVLQPGGLRATLTLGRATLFAEVLEGGAFSVEEVKLAPPQNPLTNVRKLVVVARPREVARLVVRLSSAQSHSPPAVNPLSEWATRGPTAAVAVAVAARIPSK
jgi:hypothetical protein